MRQFRNYSVVYSQSFIELGKKSAMCSKKVDFFKKYLVYCFSETSKMGCRFLDLVLYFVKFCKKRYLLIQ